MKRRALPLCGLALPWVAVLMPSAMWAQLPSSATTCRPESREGFVAAGQAFEWMPAANLVFRLTPEGHPANPPGWTIRMAPPDSPETDYSMVATPPHRFANPRYVDTGYGMTAADAVAWSPREFAFVASTEDYDVALAALDILLWPGNHSAEELDDAEAQLAAVATYPGLFTILEAQVGAPDTVHPLGHIQSLSFRLDVCVPEG